MNSDSWSPDGMTSGDLPTQDKAPPIEVKLDYFYYAIVKNPSLPYRICDVPEAYIYVNKNHTLS